ncbi:TolC family protein [Roseiconus nitratireducens]|uniref:TolC family protein n=1 Tax=Roseiconus nitratireducens TaxID=2605748 RepID=A0A5M6CZJ8_9BACT|nr:TolC family protein [Roseiconus nitratireducens]KAA5539840.1 TolC family protein [Roseiconus nitratireducens]
MTIQNESPKQLKRRRLRELVTALAVAITVPATTGCRVWDHLGPGPHDTTESYHRNVDMAIEYPEVAQCATPVTAAAETAAEPRALVDPATLPTLELTLNDAVAMAMQNSPVIRRISGTVNSVGGAATVYDPSLIATSQQGTEAALAAYDAQFNQSLNWFTTDRPNNIQTGGLGGAFTPRVTVGTAAAFQAELRKRTATGASFALRHVVDYDRNNRPFRQFSSDFNGWVEAEWRQPILRGAGLQYNRIVGNATAPGQYNGVMVARINEDTALADFESDVIALVSDVEQAYWDLWTAYRLLEANVKGRESALKTFQYQRARLEVGAGRQDEEAQAQSQFYQFQASVQARLASEDGLYAREQRLRYLLGLPATDDKLIKPTTDPIDTKVVYDWNSALAQALDRRVEIRRQRFQVKRRELELYAARLNKRPQLDLVSLYRYRGLGNNLFGDTDDGPLNGLYSSITDGDYQEWQAGFEFSLPVGLRRASAAVANARLQVNRERAVLAETELAISHDLSDAVRSLELTFQLVETNYNRYQSDLRQSSVLERRYLDGLDNINFLLQAQRQVVVSESDFYRSLANYNLAIRELHREKGSLLAYNQVQLAEGAWAPGAQMDAYEKGLFLAPRLHPEDVTIPAPITRQSFDPSAIQSTGGVPADGASMQSGPIETLPADSGLLESSPVEILPGAKQLSDEVPAEPGRRVGGPFEMPADGGRINQDGILEPPTTAE